MEYQNKHFEGERSLFALKDSKIIGCLFDNGESPLKEGRNLVVTGCTFGYKYPLWYGKNHQVSNSKFLPLSRSGIWYTDDSTFLSLDIEAPKEFRRCKRISLKDIVFHDASETLWNCEDVSLSSIKAKGDYFMMGSSKVEVDSLKLDGNYFLDGGKDIVVRNSVLNSKDAFWNCENVLVEDCVINGEYLAWNSKNVTFRRCHITSHQGLCYVDGLKMEDCTLSDSDLVFEYCRNIDATVSSVVDSIKNPISGTIRVEGVKQLILEDPCKRSEKAEILVRKGDGYELI